MRSITSLWHSTNPGYRLTGTVVIMVMVGGIFDPFDVKQEFCMVMYLLRFFSSSSAAKVLKWSGLCGRYRPPRVKDSQPYSNTVTQLVSNSRILVEIGMIWHFHRCSNFQKAVQRRSFCPLALDPIKKPRHPKLFTWFSGDWGWQYMVMYSVLGALILFIIRRKYAAASAALVICVLARCIEDWRRAKSSTKSRLFNTLAGYLLDTVCESFNC